MITMLRHVLGSNDPQFKPARATAQAYTTALNLFTPRGTGRTRLVSNLVAELSAPRLFSPFFLLLFLALLGGLTTTLYSEPRIKASAPQVSRLERRLGGGVYVSHPHMVGSTTTFPPAVHPSFGNWLLGTTTTSTPFTGHPVNFFQ